MSLNSLILCGLLLGSPGIRPLDPAVPMGSGPDHLHAGRFDAAAASFASLSDSHREAPEGPFFEGFTVWWRLLDRPPDRDRLHLRMEALFAEAARRGGALTSSRHPREQARGLTFSGAAQMLQAQSRATRGEHRAAMEAVRRGHKDLQEALSLFPGGADPLFAMGAYNYYAANLPAIVRGLRFLLHIPRGDEALGLRQLETAADRSSLFGTEALMLLAHIHSSEEQDGRRALAFLQEAARRHPDSPLIQIALADLLYRTGRFQESSSRAREALAMTRGATGFSEGIAARAGYRLAACALMLGDARTAQAAASAALAKRESLRIADVTRWGTLYADAAIELGEAQRALREIPAMRLPAAAERSCLHRLRAAAADPTSARRALGARREDIAPLADLTRAQPSAAWAQLRLGRLLDEQGRRAEARRHLQRAADVGPAEIQGWALLRLGWIGEQEGDRKQATGFYRRAASLRKFDFSLAARERLLYPGTGPPER